LTYEFRETDFFLVNSTVGSSTSPITVLKLLQGFFGVFPRKVPEKRERKDKKGLIIEERLEIEENIGK
jgi:hypothetical protein